MDEITDKLIQSYIPKLSSLSLLFRGGQKVVFSGTHEEHGKIVVKLVTSPEPDERVAREIEVATACDIPHTARIYEWGPGDIDAGLPAYIVEEFIEGVTLRQEIENRRQLDVAVVLRLISTLLETAVAMERERIVHRDIKPENIMVCADGSFTLLDFGIARHLARTSITPTGARFGPHTPGYAAPEQFRNLKKEIDIRTDLFVIGVVAYECLSGVHPFAGGARDSLDILRRTEQMVPTPLTVAGDADGQLARFITVMMSKYPSRRPTSAAVAKEWFDSIRASISTEGCSS